MTTYALELNGSLLSGQSTYKCYSNVDGCTYDDVALRKDECHSSIHDEQARLDEPYGQDLHLFHNQYKLGAIDATIDLGSAELRDVLSGFDEITACEHKLMHNRYEDGIRGLSTSVIAGLEICLGSHTIATSIRKSSSWRSFHDPRCSLREANLSITTIQQRP
jgi:hypothetical protein